MVTVKIINKSDNLLPEYATIHSAGMDLKANLKLEIGEHPKYKGKDFHVHVRDDGYVEITLLPNGRVLIPTGIHLAIPTGFVGDVRPRSGLALKHGITVLNTPGTIDSDYRGDVGVILYNTSDLDFPIEHGDRIAQLIISPYSKANLIKVDNLEESNRGERGFGSTGKK